MRYYSQTLVVGASALAATVGLAGDLVAQRPTDWTQPFPPFEIASGLYYVGSKKVWRVISSRHRGGTC